MKQLACLLCVAAVLFFCAPWTLRAEDAAPTAPAAPSEPQAPEGVEVKRHPVQAGEHLFKILRSYGVLEKNLSKAYHATVRLNPHIPDFERLGPGQILFIPMEFVPASTVHPTKELPKENKKPAPAPKVASAPSAPASVLRVPEPAPRPETPVQVQSPPATDDSKKSIEASVKEKSAPAAPSQETAPQPTPKKEVPPVVDEQPKPLDIPTREYVVQPGDRVAKILRQHANMPENRIFNEGLDLFFRLNPHIKDKNTLVTGQRVFLPLLPGKTPEKTIPVPLKSIKQTPPAPSKTVEPKVERPSPVPQVAVLNEPKPTSPSPPAAAEPASTGLQPQTSTSKDPVASGPERPINAEDRKTFLLAVLDTIGFSVLTGEDILFPVAGNEWFRVNLRRTPILRTPWGEQVALLPSQYQNQEAQFLNQMKIPLVVPDDWDPAKTLRLLEARSKGYFKLWTPGRPLILNRDGITIDLNAALIIRVQDQRFYVMNLIPGDAQPAPGLLKSFLAKYDITLMDWMRSRNSQPQLADPPASHREDLLVPWIERANAGQELSLRLGPQARNAFPEAKDLDGILAALESQGFAKRDALRLAWFQGEEREIALTFSALQIKDDQTRLVLLDWDQVSPTMVALLAMQGYGCLAVK